MRISARAQEHLMNGRMIIMKQRYNIMLSPAIVWQIDNYAKSNKTSRSKIIQQLLSDFLKSEYGFTINDESNYEIDEDQLLL